MNIKGTVKQVLAVQSGESANGGWQKQEFIIETEGQYPKQVCIGLWGDKVNTVQVGSVVNVEVNVESREYNGRWYTEVKAWKVDVVSGASQPQVNAPQSTAPQASGDDDNLPF